MARGWNDESRVMVISPEDRKYFEEMGELYVRRAMRLNDRFPFRNSAREWLAELDETQRQIREARHAKEVAEQSERTVRAAWITAFAVILALIVSILAWLFPLH
jgi:CHASE3 domain sensor protein